MINLKISGLKSVHDHVPCSHTSVETNLSMGEHLTPLTSPHPHKSSSSNFSIDNILSSKNKEQEAEHTDKEQLYTDISEDEIDVNDDDECFEMVDDRIETPSSCFTPIQPKPLEPSNSFMMKPTFPPGLSLDSDSSNNFFYSQWLAAASKPSPIFFGLQGCS